MRISKEQTMKSSMAALVPLIFATVGCAASNPPTVASDPQPHYRFTPNPYFARIGQASDGLPKDRMAILAMQGEYRVNFHFKETVALKPGYQPTADKNSSGYEYVLLAEDAPRKIVLQHILVTPDGSVIKHWRQDWIYEAAERFEFVADQTWESRATDPAQGAGTWTQCVFEVSDAPRYCGSGDWNHQDGVSTWTSDPSWRPLPRREYTKRNDYNVLSVRNRHTVTPNGWTHEQDNTKMVRDGRTTVESLVREFGFNDYRNIAGFDFKPAREYWGRTGEYWAAVRDAWHNRLSHGKTLVVNTEIDGRPLIAGTFAQAATAASTSLDEEREAIDALLAAHTSNPARLPGDDAMAARGQASPGTSGPPHRAGSPLDWTRGVDGPELSKKPAAR
jgi:hypothetical protein